MTPWVVPLSETTLGEDEARAAADVVRSGWLTQGERVAEFERAFAKYIGVAHAVAVTNCTLGLELALAAVGVCCDDEVIVPSLSFVATANAAKRLGATPIFADVVSDDDLTVDPDDVARKITPRTRAVCVMHYGGHTAAVERIRAVTALAIVEDAAHAPGARRAGVACGALGDLGAFSFFSNKNLSTGEGGMITTARDDLAAAIRATRAHGMTSSTWDRHRGHAFSYDVTTVGTNARMDEIRAAIGLRQLERLDAGNAVRRARVRQYRSRLTGQRDLGVPFGSRDANDAAHHLFVVLLPSGTDRERVMTSLRVRGIQSSIHYPPTHRFTAYSTPRIDLEVTDRVAPRLLTLPLFSTMTEAQVDAVCSALLDALDEAHR